MKNKIKKIILYLAIVIMSIVITPVNVFAANDPLSAINNLSDMLFNVARVVGIVMILYSMFQIGTSLSSHDPSLILNGVLTFVGGVLIALSKEIINAIL